jgi:hypothetical protein
MVTIMEHECIWETALGVQHEGGGGKESLLKGEDGESTLHIYI